MTAERHDPVARSVAVGRDEAEVEFTRVVAFSDGVFAIAITLLVLALEVPANTTDLGDALLNLEDDFFAYAVSFAVVGRLWLTHHRFYGSLQGFDGTLMGLNLLYLAWVVLIPFSSELLGEYGGDEVATVVYAAILIGASGTFAIQMNYAYRKDLMKEEAKAFERRYAGPANLIFVAIFAISIPVAVFISVSVAQLMWLASFLIGRRASDWVARRQGQPQSRSRRR